MAKFVPSALTARAVLYWLAGWLGNAVLKFVLRLVIKPYNVGPFDPTYGMALVTLAGARALVAALLITVPPLIETPVSPLVRTPCAARFALFVAPATALPVAAASVLLA